MLKRMTDMTKVLAILVIYLLVPMIVSHDPCGFSIKLGQCECDDPTILNCTDIALPTLDGVAEVPLSIEKIILRGCSITHVPKNLLGTVGTHRSLHLLDLSNNKIQSIDPQAFHRMKNLTTLLLDNNEWNFRNSSNYPRLFNHSQLKTLSLNNAFETSPLTLNENVTEMLSLIFNKSYMGSLETLSLSNNSLVALPWAFFSLMPNLRILDLSHNSFFKFKFDFQNLTELVELDLRSNPVKRPSDEFLSNITMLASSHKLQSVRLQDNLFNCDCGLKNFSAWLKSGSTFSNVTDRTLLKCHAAAYDSDVAKPIIQVPDESLTCNYADSAKQLQGPYILLMIVVAIVCILGVIVVYMNRQMMISRLRHCKDSLLPSEYTQYRHYATVN